MSAPVVARDFPRDARLLAGIDFSCVFETRQRVAHPLMALHWRQREAGAEGARLGLAVSRKVDRRAVVRNRIKRRLRESFRQLRPQLPPLDLVVVARAGAADASHAQLREALTGLLARAGALPRAGCDGTMPGSAPSFPS